MNLVIIQVLFSAVFSIAQFSQTYYEKEMKYLALGDSYTIGEDVDFMERFPVQLVNKLKFERYDFAMPEIIAKTGWTTEELITGIEENQPEKNFDLVTLLIGVNNQYRGQAIDLYKKEFEILLKKAISFAGDNKDKVIVISIPDYGVTPFGQKKGSEKIGKEIDQFNAANLEICKEYSIAYVDVTEISRTAYRRPNLIAEDGLHPSGEMYAKWVGEILPVAKKILKGQN